MKKWLLLVLLVLSSCTEETPVKVVIVKKNLTNVLVRRVDGQECLLYLNPSTYNASKVGDVIICRSTILGIKATEQ
jgi:hypothetical protein